MNRKIFILFLMLVLIGANNFIVLASPDESIKEKYGINYDYGEMENGLFVREIEEEIASIPRDSDDYLTEYKNAIEAHKLSALTPEMEEADYVLVDGIAYPPDEGDSPSEEMILKVTAEENKVNHFDENGNPIVRNGNGYVTFAATVETGIHEPCFVEVICTQNNKMYVFDLLEVNNYTTSVQLPDGCYLITDGGIQNDYKMEYPIQQKTFTVFEGQPVIVPFTIGEVDEDAIKNGIVIDLNEEKITNIKEEDEHESENVSELTDSVKGANGIVKRVLGYIIIIAICVLIYFKVIKKRKKE